MRGRPDVPWMTKWIKNMLRCKQRLFNQARKTNKEEDKSAFRHLRKIIKKDLNKSHMEYVTSLLDFGQIENNKPKCSITKRFWSYIKGRKRDNVGIPTLKVKDQELVKNFNLCSQMKLPETFVKRNQFLGHQ